jgi:apolipoprotein D and lipocalin family protein
MKHSLFLSIILSLFSTPFSADRKVYDAVSPFQLSRYLGTWYEIARMPSFFEDGLTNVTATYSLNSNGTVRVENRGLKNGSPSMAIGKARFAGAPTTGYLQVSFFGPFYSDYKIVALDSSYRYALIGSSTKYLWILCRQPTLDKSIISVLLEQARNLGFDISRVYFTPQ